MFFRRFVAAPERLVNNFTLHDRHDMIPRLALYRFGVPGSAFASTD